MSRRELLAVSGALAGGCAAPGAVAARDEPPALGEEMRRHFPGLDGRVYLNAAAGTPLSTFTERGLLRYQDLWRNARGGYSGEVREEVEEVRRLFAQLIGAQPTEIAFVQCTKAGEQLVLERMKGLRPGHGNVVTNDLHFSGSLNNLVGWRKRGLDVRIVRARDWRINLTDMQAAIDDRTALVAITLVSNINGHVEPIREIAEAAHAHGAYVYADIIQAAGVVPIDVRAMGIDFAACSTYKWLFGPFGCGFLFVREDLQGDAIVDRSFPGYARPNYAPWVASPDGDVDFHSTEPEDARRYQPGHVSYLSYCALGESLRLLTTIGVERVRDHCVELTQGIVQTLDPAQRSTISPHLDRSPIVTFLCGEDVPAALRDAGIGVSYGGGRLRISPSIYNTEADIEHLGQVLGDRLGS